MSSQINAYLVQSRQQEIAAAAARHHQVAELVGPTPAPSAGRRTMSRRIRGLAHLRPSAAFATFAWRS